MKNITVEVYQTDTVPYNANEESEFMKLMYSEINRRLQPHVITVLNQYEYPGSPVYSENGFSREELGQMVDRVFLSSQTTMDTTQEIYLSENISTFEHWNKKEILKNFIESLLLNEIFNIRRPRYFNIRSNYRFKEGIYDGINYYKL